MIAKKDRTDYGEWNRSKTKRKRERKNESKEK